VKNLFSHLVGELFSNHDHFSILLIWLCVNYGDMWFFGN
jgi:hypothetical protein